MMTARGLSDLHKSQLAQPSYTSGGPSFDGCFGRADGYANCRVDLCPRGMSAHNGEAAIMARGDCISLVTGRLAWVSALSERDVHMHTVDI